MFPKIIGITGRKYNGKDTLGKFFIERMKYTRLAFADPLKEACRCIFGFTEEQLYGNEKEINDKYWQVTPRKVLQYVGTDLMRDQLGDIIPHIGQDIWIEVVRKKILDFPDVCFVITDVRFPNEINMIKQLGGINIRVSRESVNTVVDPHPSELLIEQLIVDYEINNNGTIQQLFDKAMQLQFVHE